MIHDGLAENGHYYSYVFDRSQSVWWKLDDHRVSKASEEDVMKEALGGDGYKSACNLFYMSKHIADLNDKNKVPVFSPQRAKSLRIPAGIQKDIERINAEYTLKTQHHLVQKAVQQINQCFKERLQKQDSQQGQLQQIVETKLYSFYYYLASINHRGYGRWTLLSQAVKELHPQRLGLKEIIAAKGPGELIDDEVYKLLKNHFSEKFLMLSESEAAQLRQREEEYKGLWKKALLL